MIQLPTMLVNDVPQGGIYVGYGEYDNQWHTNIIIARHEDDRRIKKNMTLCADFAEYMSLITKGKMRVNAVWQFPNSKNCSVWFTGIIIPIKKLNKVEMKRLVVQARLLRMVVNENNKRTNGEV